ncbi:uncharacterized protein LOC144580767 [Callithrix jacchus]
MINVMEKVQQDPKTRFLPTSQRRRSPPGTPSPETGSVTPGCPAPRPPPLALGARPSTFRPLHPAPPASRGPVGTETSRTRSRAPAGELGQGVRQDRSAVPRRPGTGSPSSHLVTSPGHTLSGERPGLVTSLPARRCSLRRLVGSSASWRQLVGTAASSPSPVLPACSPESRWSSSRPPTSSQRTFRGERRQPGPASDQASPEVGTPLRVPLRPR